MNSVSDSSWRTASASDYTNSSVSVPNSDSKSTLLHHGFSFRKEINRVFLRGGSAFDAWLTASTVQVAQVLLTLPYSLAQMGMVPGIIFQIVYGLLGCWSCYLITSLYSDYMRILESQNSRHEDEYIIQWYEVLDLLLGPRWKLAGIISTCIHLVGIATIQIIACGSIVWYINNNLDKRRWTFIFGAGCLFTVFIPSARSYRFWNFIGVFMTSYTAWFMTLSALTHERVHDVQHTGVSNSVQYFTGATNILYAFGGHALTLEIMDAMRKPMKFKTVYFYAVLYTFTLTIPSAASVYWRFGDTMLHNPNALAVFPRTRFRDAAVVLMLAHQFIEFAANALPAYIMWEKLIGVHKSKTPYILKSLARVPIVLFVWFIAIAIPFFGPINSAIGSVVCSITVYILPSLAFMVLRRDPESRKNAVEQPPSWLPGGWISMYCISLGLVLWVGIIGMGFGAWASFKNLTDNVGSFGFFARCYQCS